MNTNDILNNGTEFEFDAGAVDGIDQSSVEGGGVSYPLIQWVNGAVTAKKFGGMDYMGGFFVKKAPAIDADKMAANGWAATERTFKSGASEEGYWKREAAISIISERRRWEVMGADGKLQVFPWNKYDSAKAAGDTPRGRNQYLVLVKGLEDVGPFVLTLKGSAAKAFEFFRDKDAVLSRFSATVIAAANIASDAAAKKSGKPTGNRWPYRAFWLPVGANRDEKGNPTYTEVGQGNNKTSVVLPVALALPDRAEQVDLKRYYVGKTALDAVNDLYDSAADWRTAWDNITPGAPADGNHADAAPVEKSSSVVAVDANAVAAAALGL